MMDQPEHPTSAPPVAPVGWRRYMGIGLVTTALVMVAGFGAYVVSILGSLEDHRAMVRELEEELSRNQAVLSILRSDQVELVYLSGPGKGGQPAGRLLWDRERRLGVLYLHGLDSLGTGREYRLWAVVDGKPSTGVPLIPASSGTLVRILDRIPNPPVKGKEMFIVTAEPTGNSGGPAGTLVLAGSPAHVRTPDTGR